MPLRLSEGGRPFGGSKARLGRRTKVGASAAGVVVVVGGVVIGLTVGGGQAAKHHPPSKAAAAAAKARTRTSAPFTPANSPTQPAVVELSNSTASATYQVSSSAFTVAVNASGPCWIEAKRSANSTKTLYEGTLEAGTRHSIDTTGSVWVRLGAPENAQVSLDGTAVQLPPGSSPFNLSFETTSA